MSSLNYVVLNPLLYVTGLTFLPPELQQNVLESYRSQKLFYTKDICISPHVLRRIVNKICIHTSSTSQSGGIVVLWASIDTRICFVLCYLCAFRTSTQNGYPCSVSR